MENELPAEETASQEVPGVNSWHEQNQKDFFSADSKKWTEDLPLASVRRTEDFF